MQPNNRPTSVLVIAIFHFIVGGGGLLCDLIGAASLVAGGGQPFVMQSDPKQAQLQKDIQAAMNNQVPGYSAVQIGNTVLAFIFDAVLITAGIGLLKMAAWGRSLSLGYGIVSLLQKVGMAFYSILFVLPALGTVFQSLQTQAQTPQERQLLDFMQTGAKIGGLGGACVPMIYPFVVLLIMNLGSVKEAFRRQGMSSPDGGPPPTDYQDPFRPGGQFPPDDRIRS